MSKWRDRCGKAFQIRAPRAPEKLADKFSLRIIRFDRLLCSTVLTVLSTPMQVSFSPALRSGKSLTKNKLFACGKSFTKKMGALEPRKGNPVFGQAFAAGEKLG